MAGFNVKTSSKERDMYPLITVIVPLYNRAHLISETIDSILNQKYKNIEVIIVDDGSTDSPMDVLSKYNTSIRYIKIENSGAAIARKVGIELAFGDWIALCDSDDIWKENHLSDFILAREQFDNFDFYFTDFLTTISNKTKFNEAPLSWQKNVINIKDAYFLKTSPTLFDDLLEFQCIFTSATIFSKNAYKKVGGISDDVSRVYSEDLHFTLKIANNFKGVICNHPNVIIRKHDDNFSSDFAKVLRGEIIILEMLMNEPAILEKNRVPSIKKTIVMRKYNYFLQAYWYLGNSEAYKSISLDILKHFQIKDFIKLVVVVFKNFFVR